MKTNRKFVFGLIIGATALVIFGCARNIYELPAPPPAEARVSSASEEDGAAAREEMIYLEARAALLSLYNLLSTQRYAEATQMVSRETTDFLTSGTDRPLEEVLASGRLVLPNGQTVDFEPVSLLLAQDVSTLTRAPEGISSHETESRREIFAQQDDGSLIRVVMIREGGQWVLHRTRLPQPIQPE